MMHRVNPRLFPTALTALAVAALTLTGCSGSDSTDPAAASTPAPAATAPAATLAPTETPAPEPTVMTKAEAGARYLQLVKGRNAALIRAGKLIPTGAQPAAIGDLDKAKAAAGDLADATKVQLDGMSDSSVWPKNVRTQVEDIAEDRANELTYLRQAEKATTKTALAEAWNMGASAHPEAAQLLRSKLGLPES